MDTRYERPQDWLKVYQLTDYGRGPALASTASPVTLMDCGITVIRNDRPVKLEIEAPVGSVVLVEQLNECNKTVIFKDTTLDHGYKHKNWVGCCVRLSKIITVGSLIQPGRFLVTVVPKFKVSLAYETVRMHQIELYRPQSDPIMDVDVIRMGTNLLRRGQEGKFDFEVDQHIIGGVVAARANINLSLSLDGAPMYKSDQQWVLVRQGDTFEVKVLAEKENVLTGTGTQRVVERFIYCRVGFASAEPSLVFGNTLNVVA
jgi:hypothetical protein